MSKKPAQVIYQLKIVLNGSKPPIWRRVTVPGTILLSQLHDVVQVAMGWTDSHLHRFEIGPSRYTGVYPGGDPFDNGELDDAEYRLCDLVKKATMKFAYEYDFGDSWDHQITVEKITDAAAPLGHAECLSGKKGCPPEDCGGLWGYYQLLNTLADPQAKEHKMMMEWTGGPIDPDEFDLAAVNSRLKKMRI